MRLSIGMAVHDDFDGAFFTIQALRLYHPEVMRETEILVVDNSPESTQGQALRGQANWWTGAAASGHLGGFQYIPMPSPIGTSAPRDKVFRMAKAKHVLCIDCHVLIAPGGLKRLLDYWDQDGNSKDLVCGPLIYDGLDTYSTHFDDVWRGDMWGTWAVAWRCGCGELYGSQDQGGQLRMATLMARYPVETLNACTKCHRAFPAVPWPGHEASLKENGFSPAAENADSPPFEIPAQGLGLFGARKAAWPGFNPRFLGFGGEEWYIHEKIRQAGGKVLCLPFLGWNHRFVRPDGVKYPLTTWYKIRNYVIGHAELGLPMDRIREHFFDSNRIPKNEWDDLMADPIAPPEWPTGVPRAPAPAPMPPPAAAAPAAVQVASKGVVAGQPADLLESLYQAASQRPSDLNEHAPKLRELAGGLDQAVELVGRQGVTTISILAGQPKHFRSFGEMVDPSTETLKTAARNCDFQYSQGNSLDVEIPESDLVLINTRHTAARLAAELQRHASKARRWLVFLGTHTHGEQGDDGGEGMHYALRPWAKANPQWFVSFHTAANNGLTILGRQEADKPNGRYHAWNPNEGPGTELKAILASMGIEAGKTCDCNARVVSMDFYGVQGCKEHREEIIGWLKDGQHRWGWKDKILAGARAVASGLVFRLNLADPFPGLVDEAIRRAEVKEKNG